MPSAVVMQRREHSRGAWRPRLPNLPISSCRRGDTCVRRFSSPEFRSVIAPVNRKIRNSTKLQYTIPTRKQYKIGAFAAVRKLRYQTGQHPRELLSGDGTCDISRQPFSWRRGVYSLWLHGKWSQRCGRQPGCSLAGCRPGRVGPTRSRERVSSTEANRSRLWL